MPRVADSGECAAAATVETVSATAHASATAAATRGLPRAMARAYTSASGTTGSVAKRTGFLMGSRSQGSKRAGMTANAKARIMTMRRIGGTAPIPEGEKNDT